MSIQHITCIVCPKGCVLEVDAEKGEVSGNSCERGRAHGLAEATNPQRVLTTTVRVADSTGRAVEMAPARTRGAIPKRLMFDAMREVGRLRATLPIKRGDVLLANIASSGVDLIATRDLS